MAKEPPDTSCFQDEEGTRVPRRPRAHFSRQEGSPDHGLSPDAHSPPPPAGLRLLGRQRAICPGPARGGRGRLGVQIYLPLGLALTYKPLALTETITAFMPGPPDGHPLPSSSPDTEEGPCGEGKPRTPCGQSASQWGEGWPMTPGSHRRERGLGGGGSHPAPSRPLCDLGRCLRLCSAVCAAKSGLPRSRWETGRSG